MNPLQSITVPERDAPAQAGKRPAKGGASAAFDSEIRGMEKRAAGPKDGSAKAEAETGSEPEPASPGDETAVAKPNAQDVAGLLQALGGARGTRVSTPETDAAPAEGAASATAGRVDASASAETEGDAAPRVRLKLLHQETHFEPTLREAVLVDRESESEGGRGERATREPSILQLLDAKREADGKVQAEAGSTADAPSPRPALPAAGADGERRIVRIDAGALGLARSGATQPAGVTDEDADVPAREAEMPDEGAAETSAAFERRARPSDRAAARELVLPWAPDRQPAREAEPMRVLQSGLGVPADASTPTLSTQIAGRIVDAFAGTSSLQRPDAPNLETHLRLRAGGSVLKTLTIQLQPEHLGTLDVSMRLKEGQLVLEMAASRAETARLLTDDRPALKALLEKAGFSLDEASIVVVARETAPAAQSSSARDAGPGAGGGEGRSGGETSGGGDRGQARGEPGDRRGPFAEAPRQVEAQERGGTGTVFL